MMTEDERAQVEHMIGTEEGCPMPRYKFITVSAVYQLATGHYIKSWAECPDGVRTTFRDIAEMPGATVGEITRAWLLHRAEHFNS